METLASIKMAEGPESSSVDFVALQSYRSASLLNLFRSVGTGFMISPYGDIITCAHVVKGSHRIQDGEVLGVHRNHIYPGISFGVPADVVLQFLNSTPADASQPRPSALASLFRSLQPACRMEESNSPMAPQDQTHSCQQLQHQFAW